MNSHERLSQYISQIVLWDCRSKLQLFSHSKMYNEEIYLFTERKLTRVVKADFVDRAK